MKTKLLTLFAIMAVCLSAQAKRTLHINPEVTTLVVMPEAIKMVDISTDKVIGNQCTDNVVRIKPYLEEDGKFGEYSPGETLGTISIIGERNIVQYDLVFASRVGDATMYHEVSYDEVIPYINPEVSMPQTEMARYAWAVYGTKRKFNNIRFSKHGIKAFVNNIYTMGDYFFIDYTLENKSKIPYSIAELRIKLTDKKETKATNSQTTELRPVYSLNVASTFKKTYRNVIVLEKLTFPEEKVLKLEISEDQISGRVVELTIEYDDILNADGFERDILKNRVPKYKAKH